MATDARTFAVYYVKAIDPNGYLVDLGKFFRPEHAKAHLARFSMTSKGAAWREEGIVIVQERPEDQHAAHQGDPKTGRKAAWE